MVIVFSGDPAKAEVGSDRRRRTKWVSCTWDAEMVRVFGVDRSFDKWLKNGRGGE